MEPPAPPLAVNVVLPQNVPPPLTVTAAGSGSTDTETGLELMQPFVSIVVTV